MKTRKLIKIMFMCCALSLVMGVFASASNYTTVGQYDNYNYSSTHIIISSLDNDLSFNAGYEYSLTFNINTINNFFETVMIRIIPSGYVSYLNINNDLTYYSAFTGWNYNISNISYENNILNFTLKFNLNSDTDNGFSSVSIRYPDGVDLPENYNEFIGGFIYGEPSPSENLMSGINSVSSSLLDSTRSIFSFITSSNVLPYVLIGVSVSLVSVIIYFGKRYIF